MLAQLISVMAVGAPSPEGARPPAPTLSASFSEETPSQDGTFTLKWNASAEAEDVQFDVEMDTSGTGTAYAHWYRGPAKQSFVSGLPDGLVLVRARSKIASGRWSAWSTPSRIRIQHHSYEKTSVLLGIGLLVFTIIAAYVGYFALKDEEPAV